MKFIIVLILTLLTVNLKAQLFKDKNIYPEVKQIKGKYFSGSGGKGYWSIDSIDSLGRIVRNKNFQKEKLLSETEILYNKASDEIMRIEHFDINNLGKVDTSWIARYEYDAFDNIKYEMTKYSEFDSTTLKLLSIRNDSVYTYTRTSYYYRKDTSWSYQENHEVIYNQNHQMSRWSIEDSLRNFKETRFYQYYENKKLKSKIIERIPELETVVYVGGPGSDKQSWTYKYDKKGRIKREYTFVNGKKYKIAKYSYLEW